MLGRGGCGVSGEDGAADPAWTWPSGATVGPPQGQQSRSGPEAGPPLSGLWLALQCACWRRPDRDPRKAPAGEEPGRAQPPAERGPVCVAGTPRVSCSRAAHTGRSPWFRFVSLLVRVCPSPMPIFLLGFWHFLINFRSLCILRKLSLCCDLCSKWIFFPRVILSRLVLFIVILFFLFFVFSETED